MSRTAFSADHPLRVESVAWISARKDVLSTFFALLSLLAYVRYARSKGTVQIVFYILAIVSLALGLMAKTVLVVLPFAMWLIDYWPLQRTQKIADPKETDGAGQQDVGLETSDPAKQAAGPSYPCSQPSPSASPT